MSDAPRNQVFISYSHQDKEWFDLLFKMLSPLERNQTIEVWWDGRITPGQEWLTEIRGALNSARVAVLLVSPDFLASQFILNEELPRILDRAKSGGVVLFWCLVKNCLWKETPLKGYQAAHAPAKVWNRLSQGDLLALLEEVGNKFWCLVKNCLWKETPLKGYQAAHAPAKVWNRLSQGDLLALLEEVGNKIKEAFEQSAAPLPVALEVPPPLPARPHGIRGCGASRVARGRAGRRSPLVLQW